MLHHVVTINLFIRSPLSPFLAYQQVFPRASRGEDPHRVLDRSEGQLYAARSDTGRWYLFAADSRKQLRMELLEHYMIEPNVHVFILFILPLPHCGRS
jgi:hypothetical protein